jgi:hypothetical protein
MVDCCELCYGLRGHRRIKDAMCEWFEEEFREASAEVDRLRNLFKEVCWYNFETQCKKWSHPWPASLQSSLVTLHSTRIVIDDKHGRRRREIGSFPIYYRGAVCDAPPLPPEILLVELKAACEYQQKCKEQRMAPLDWAPGGRLYTELLESTKVPSEHGRKRSRAQEAAKHISRRLGVRA